MSGFVPNKYLAVNGERRNICPNPKDNTVNIKANTVAIK